MPPLRTIPIIHGLLVEPAQFVGRGRLLRALETELAVGRSVSIVGDWRIGKSSVLRYLAKQHRGRDLEVRHVSGDGPEGVSPGALVTAMTGVTTPDEPDRAADVLSDWAESVDLLGLVDELDGLIRF